MPTMGDTALSQPVQHCQWAFAGTSAVTSAVVLGTKAVASGGPESLSDLPFLALWPWGSHITSLIP